MSQPFPAVLGGRWSALEGGYQSNDSNGLRLPSPTAYGNLAAWYDVSDYSSLVVDGSNRVSLIADKSGNSATNCLCLNGASGNYASAPDSAALDITSDLELRFDCRINTLARVECFGAKRGAAAAAGSSYWLQKSITGLLQFYYSDGASFFQFDSTATLGSVGLSNLQRVQLRVTVDKDNGASGTTVQFFYRTDGIITGTSGWTQLGSNVTVAGTNAINNSSSVFEVGSQQGGTVDAFLGNIFRAQVYNGIAGTLVFDANFATASKLATSFTESSSNAATVTINSSGEHGARISGERDYINLTSANQLVYSSSSRSATGNGTSQNMRTARFALSQPYVRYTVVKQVSWASGDYLLDGANGANSGAVIQTTATPQLNLNAGSSVAANTDLAVGTLSLLIQDFNGASSALAVGSGTATTGNAGSTAANGLTLLASGATTAANHGNGEVCEDVIFTGTHDSTTKARLRAYFRAKWGIAA